MKKILLVSAVVTAIAASGCANMTETQQTTARGAGIGAVAGAVIGAATGNRSTAAKGAAIGAGVGALGGYVWSQRMEEQKRRMEQATQGTGVDVTQTQDNQLKLNIPSDISFDVGRSNIKSNFAPILDQFATSLRNNPGTEVRIVGHTDSTGSDAINNPLSVDRAASTRDYLVARGVPMQRIAIEGRGSHQPIASNQSASGRAQNRRVEIFVGEPQQAAQR